MDAQPNEPYLEDAYIDNNFYWGFTPPPTGTIFVPTSAPTNPFSSAYVDQAGDGQTGEIVTARNRLLQYPRYFQNDSSFCRAVGGFRGDVSEDLHWEAAANINRDSLDYENSGLIDINAFDAAMADGQINPFAITQAPGAVNGVVGTAVVDMLSTLNSFDFKIDGTALELPSGKLGFAVGASYVRESLSAAPDLNSMPNSFGSSQGWSNAPAIANFSDDRTITSEFAELVVPVTSAKQDVLGAHVINFDAAVRYDAYSGAVGAATDPEASMSWVPIHDQFKFRGSAGRSFIAPSLYSLYGPIGTGGTSLVTYNVYNGNGAQDTAVFNGTERIESEIETYQGEILDGWLGLLSKERQGPYDRRGLRE